jgi:hypothetical protein
VGGKMIVSREKFDQLSLKGGCSKCKQVALVVKIVERQKVKPNYKRIDDFPKMLHIIEVCWPCIQIMEKEEEQLNSGN